MTADSELSSELQRVLQEFGQTLKPLSPDESVAKFLKNEKTELSQITLAEYERELERFVDFCEQEGVEDTSEFDGRVLNDFKIWRRDEAHNGEGSLSKKTMRDEMYLLRKFLRFLESIEAATPGLHEKIEIPSLDSGDGKLDIEFTPEELDAILAHLEKYKYASREHVVWMLFADTGRRRSGLHSLDRSNVYLTDCYVEFEHHENETELKNDEKSEKTVSISEKTAQVLRDYIENNRVDYKENGRAPLLTTTQGRLTKSTISKYVYKWSRPCVLGQECPSGRDPETCEAMESSDCASKCPHSKPSVALRHGYISQLRRQKVSLTTISERCDVSERIIEEHYSELTEAEKRELRREEIKKVDNSEGGYL